MLETVMQEVQRPVRQANYPTTISLPINDGNQPMKENTIMELNEIILIIQILIADVVVLVDSLVKQRVANRIDRVAVNELGLPGRTPRTERASGCLMGATAIISQLLNSPSGWTTNEVHGVAERLLMERGHSPSWGAWVSSAPTHQTVGMWHNILSRLQMPLPRNLHYPHNSELAGKGVLLMTNMQEGHAVAYASGLVSDPSRPAGSTTWETLLTVLQRYDMVPTMLYVFEDCADGKIGFVPLAGHTCTYQSG